MSEANIFQWVGVGLNEEEWYLIHKTIKKFASLTGCTRIRFWGQLLCSKKDLYVIEMKPAPDPTYEPIPGEEKRGEGINAYVYWVTHDLLGEWQKLPDIRGEHIAAARKIKKLLSGDLEAEVLAYPFFPDKEAYLIRAQIARITAATVLVPKGTWKEKEGTTSIHFK